MTIPKKRSRDPQSLPWFKFYAADWLEDAALRLCTLAAQGICVRVMCLMHRAEPYGHLYVAGKPLDLASLSRVLGEAPDILAPLLEELEENAVFERDARGALCSPVLVRLQLKHEQDVEYGRQGGNRKLKGEANPRGKPRDKGGVQREDTGGVNPPDDPDPDPGDKAQISDIRSQSIPAADAADDSGEVGGEASSPHAEARRLWSREFEDAVGKPYVFDGSADGSQIKRLLAKPDYSPEELQRRARIFLRSPFWAKQGRDLRRFVSQWTALGNAEQVGDGEQRSPAPLTQDLAEWLRHALQEGPGSMGYEQALRALKARGMSVEEFLGVAP